MDELLCLISGNCDGILGENDMRLLRDSGFEIHECCKDFDNLVNAVSDNVSCVVVGMDNKQLP